MDLKKKLKEHKLSQVSVAKVLYPNSPVAKQRFNQKLNNTVIGTTRQRFTEQEEKDIEKIIYIFLASKV